MQARFYLPWFGRFASPDPALDQHFQVTQSWNIYSYVMNNPTMKIDPTGMIADSLSGLSDEKRVREERRGISEVEREQRRSQTQTNQAAPGTAPVATGPTTLAPGESWSALSRSYDSREAAETSALQRVQTVYDKNPTIRGRELGFMVVENGKNDFRISPIFLGPKVSPGERASIDIFGHIADNFRQIPREFAGMKLLTEAHSHPRERGSGALAPSREDRENSMNQPGVRHLVTEYGSRDVVTYNERAWALITNYF